MDGKGYLLNEPGAQPTSVYGEFSCKEEPEVDSPGGKMTLDPSSFSKMGKTMEVVGETWGPDETAAEVKASFLNSSGYRQLADWLWLPGPQVCLR